MQEGKSATFRVDSKKAAFAAANACEDRKARGTLVMDVRQITVLADYFVVTQADSVNQVRAIADSVVEAMQKLGLKPHSVEGKGEARWVLLDFGDLIIHILQERERNFYKLEQFWNRALIVDREDWVNE